MPKSTSSFRSAYPAVQLQASAVRRLRGRYPFGHQADIAQAPAGLSAGEVVQVRTPDGGFIGLGYFNAESPLPLRMLSWQDQEIDLGFYRQRLRQALARRSGRISGTDACRVLHAEADGLPGVIADRFGAVLAVQLRNAGTERHRELILKALQSELDVSAAYERSDTAERRKEGLSEQTGTLWGEVPERIEFFEDDLNFHFQPFSAQKTGFFLDQRDNRRLMRRLVQPGDQFLDVYSYTGGFSLHAAKAGAHSTAIDKDQVALGVLEQVARHSGLHVNLRWGDALEQLQQLGQDKKRFQLAVIDPPTLAKRKDEVPAAKRVFSEAVSSVLKVLTPGGSALVSTCAHYLRVEDLLDACRIAAAQADTDAEVLEITYQPADHPHLLSVPESLYLKSVLLKRN